MNTCSITDCNRPRRGKQLLCGVCQVRLWRLANPERTCFHNLKSSAKRRDIEFSLTFEEFNQFCIETNYLVGRGRTKQSFSVDRIRNEEGYHKDNIQKLTISQNASKGTKKLEGWWDEQERKMKFTVKDLSIKRQEPDEDCPF